MFERILFWWTNIKRRSEGLAPFTPQQWEIDRTLRTCTITARHVYFLLATGATYEHDPAKFAAYLTEWSSHVFEGAGTAYAETDIAAAYNELQVRGLMDSQYRPCMMYDIV